ncbi:hypothetical protein BH24ACT4_BH24ACT4_17440 [soil metagenome]
MLRPRSAVAVAVVLVTVGVLVGCADTHGQREVACRNLADPPSHARSDAVEHFWDYHCGADVDEMCRATLAYFRAIDPAPLDPVEALSDDTPNDEAMAALAAAFRDVEADVGTIRARDLNRNVVDAALSTGGRHGPAVAWVMQLMPGGADVVTVETPPEALVLFRVGLEAVVDVCFEGRPLG